MGRSCARRLATALLVGCLGPAATVASNEVATLAPASPRLEFALRSTPAADAVLEVVVLEVRNPKNVPVGVLVTLQDSARKTVPVEVMRFALFPADKPGRFIGRADKALDQLAAHLGARPGRLILAVEFDPAAGAAPARSSVELSVSADWVAMPGTGR